MTIDVFDKDGKPQTWAWLEQKYRVRLRDAGAGAKFRLVRVDETDGPAVFIVDVRDAQGRPKTNQPVAFHWKEVGQEEKAVDLRKDPDLKSRWFDHALVQQSSVNGDTGFGFGSGSITRADGGPHTLWVLSPTLPSDALSGVGWLGGTNHMGPNRLTFQIVEETEGSGGGNEGGAGGNRPTDSELLARLDALHADLRKVMKHLGIS